MAWARLFSTFCILARSPTSDSKARNRLQISMDFSGGTCPEDRTRSYRTRVLLSSGRKSFHMCSMHEHCVLHKVQYCVNVYFLTLLNAGLNLEINKKFLLVFIILLTYNLCITNLNTPKRKITIQMRHKIHIA